MKHILFPKLGLVLLFYTCWLQADMGVVSLDGTGRPMAQGVCDVQAAVADDGAVAFIAPMPDRADSRANGFHASYLRNGGQLRELLPGYERALAQPPLSVYSKTTCVRLAANRDFDRFAAIVEFVKTGRTVNGIVVPTMTGTRLVVTDGNGGILSEADLDSDKGNVAARQCHVSFSGDGKLLAVCGQYLGLRLYDAPTTDLASFRTLDVGYTMGKAVITGDGTKVFFTRDDMAEEYAVWRYDVATGNAVDTGLRASRFISDAQLAASHDGSCVVFRRSSDSLVIASWENGRWKETVVEGEQIRQPAVSADGRYVVYQVRGRSCLQIMSYDRWQGTAVPVSRRENGDEADADCTSPSISADGLKVAFVSAASNLAAGSDGRLQLYAWDRGVLSMPLELKRGWNLCGLPFEPDGGSVARLKDVGVCWGWMNGQFKLLDSLMMGQGFWLYSLSDMTLRLTGVETEAPPLRRGWNLVLPSVVRMEEAKACFALEGCSYVRVSNPMDFAKPLWVFY